VEGRAPVPPAAQTLGFRLLGADPDRGTIEVEFDGRAAFTNPHGEVLGGFLSAMLYDTVGPALLCTLDDGEFIETDDLQVRFLHPAQQGAIVGRGRVVERDGDRATLEASLSDSDGTILATATATARVVPLRSPDGPTGQ
jgi:uncharacterized protein (TIGR00369 family)